LVVALGMTTAAPALGQVADAPPTETPAPNAAQSPDAPPAEAPAAEAPPVPTAPPADAAPPADPATEAPAVAASPVEPEPPAPEAISTAPAETPATAAAQSTDAQAADGATAEPPAVVEPSATAARMAAWVLASADNGGLPFVIVDKLAAEIFVFDAAGQLLGGAPALVGLAQGDDSADGVGERALSAITPDERTTPAGRFVAAFGRASGGRTVLWVDYATAISLHPVVTTNPSEQRQERIRSSAPEDHRISFGCINVPQEFYEQVVLQAFQGGSGVVYILPDTKPLEEVFPGFALAARTSGAGPVPEAPVSVAARRAEAASPADPASAAPADAVAAGDGTGGDRAASPTDQASSPPPDVAAASGEAQGAQAAGPTTPADVPAASSEAQVPQAASAADPTSATQVGDPAPR
jgi:hypothetical protein